jgi:hypothetical protein
MDSIKKNILKYLNEDTDGALLIDDLNHVGKTYTILDLFQNKQFNINPNYYCYLDVNEIIDVDLESYIIDNLKNVYTNDCAYPFLDSLKKYPYIFLIKKLKYISQKTPKLFIDFTNSLFKVFFEFIILFFSIFSQFQISKNITSTLFSPFKKLKNKNIHLNQNFVLIIDHIEMKNESFSIKNFFNKLTKLKESNKIKIILIINSNLLSLEDKIIFNSLKNKLIHFSLNFQHNYNNHALENNILYVKNKLQNFENLSFILNDNFIKNIIENDINLSNVINLFRINKLAFDINNIEKEILYNYNTQIINNNLENKIQNELLKVKTSLILFSFSYLNSNLINEDYEDYSDYDVISNYFNSDISILKELLELTIEDYLYEDPAKVFYKQYLIDNPIVKNKIISNKPQIIKSTFNNNLSIYDLFSEKEYYPVFVLIEGLEQIIDRINLNVNDNINYHHFSLLNILEKIYEVKKIELTFLLIEFDRITEHCYYLDIIINNLKFESNFFYRIIYILDILRQDIFVRELKSKFNQIFSSFNFFVNNKYFSKFSIYDNQEVFEYFITYNENFNIVSEIIDSCLYHGIDFIQGFLKFVDIDPDYMLKQIEYNEKILFFQPEIIRILSIVKKQLYDKTISKINLELDYLLIKKEKDERLSLININGQLFKTIYN